MKSVLEEFPLLWPENRIQALRDYLTCVFVVRVPEQEQLLSTVDKKNTIVVVSNGEDTNLVSFLDQGFEHVLCANRSDFAQELLASAMMILRPETFLKNPLKFFFSGFLPPEIKIDPDRNGEFHFERSEDKTKCLEGLNEFLQQEPRLMGIQDLCLQVADEMITNALYNAPVELGGKRTHKHLARHINVKLPGSKRGELFVCYSDERVIVGCSDLYGSVEKKDVLRKLSALYEQESIQLLTSSAGAGIGLSYLVDHSANFYLYCEKGRRTIFACSFLLKGLKANTGPSKHLHVSVR